MGAITWSGYGQIGVRSTDATYRMVGVHRVVYEALVGPIPDGMTIDHQCHNIAAARGECRGGWTCLHRRCCNPAHLEPATGRENNLRGLGPALNKARFAAKSHCPHGHPYDESNTRIRPDGRRACRTCNRTWKRHARSTA